MSSSGRDRMVDMVVMRRVQRGAWRLHSWTFSCTTKSPTRSRVVARGIVAFFVPVRRLRSLCHLPCENPITLKSKFPIHKERQGRSVTTVVVFQHLRKDTRVERHPSSSMSHTVTSSDSLTQLASWPKFFADVFISTVLRCLFTGDSPRPRGSFSRPNITESRLGSCGIGDAAETLSTSRCTSSSRLPPLSQTHPRLILQTS
jgi:hypothetical protein